MKCILNVLTGNNDHKMTEHNTHTLTSHMNMMTDVTERRERKKD